ncbi:MAG: AAA family ATPase, partial [Clostridia bacterium]|nr:AAA family ATPase [Clostridia bacterium]
MAYQALYRTWRPMRFNKVVGQDHITKILSGQISLDKTSHAYLFAGPRGTGKTSLAKIFASAVNCTDRDGFEPCGKCASCTSDSIDIIEIDAASNNSVDNVREIRERVNLLPALCSHKIYIIDEAHM